jgi:hypothetical protein
VLALASVDDDRAFRMIDQPCVRRQPSCPLPIAKDGEPPAEAAPSPADLSCLDPNCTGLDCVELHAFSAIERSTAGALKWTM